MLCCEMLKRKLNVLTDNQSIDSPKENSDSNSTKKKTQRKLRLKLKLK